jgi:hypothetical protein
VRNSRALPPLAVTQILAWADAYHRRTGKWPTVASGAIPEAPGETWPNVRAALFRHSRGTPPGLTLARLLAQYRGRRNHYALPHLTIKQVLAWADAHHERTDEWPRHHSGPIAGTDGEKWSHIEAALWNGNRGLPADMSLARLLAKCRGVRNLKTVPRLTSQQILAWADAHHRRTGQWPTLKAVEIPEAPGETWTAVNAALWGGGRGLRGGSSLIKLLAAQRGVRNHLALPVLTIKQILVWADAYHKRTGAWPTAKSGPIPNSDGLTWSAVVVALAQGHRGWSRGHSLAGLLAEQRGKRNIHALPPLTVKQILTWADAHHQRTGKWPGEHTGAIPEAPGENWLGIHRALAKGQRGLRTALSLQQLLIRHGRKPARPPLRVTQVLAWADAHKKRTGRWPSSGAGCIPEAPHEIWGTVDMALRMGSRGLPSGSSIARLLADRRGVVGKFARPPLTVQKILAWADAHHARTGKWPTRELGKIPGAPGESWRNVSAAMSQGLRGLAPDSSLARVLAQHRGRRNHLALPHLTVRQVLAWADAHHRRTGQWPRKNTGPIPGSDGETWSRIEAALWHGGRGLPARLSLPRLLAQHRGCASTRRAAPASHSPPRKPGRPRTSRSRAHRQTESR